MLHELKQMLAEREIGVKDALRLMLRAQMSMLMMLDEQKKHTHPEFKTMAGRDWITAVVAMVGAAFAVWMKR